MDGNNDKLTVGGQKYQTLGKKVFWLFFLQVSPAAFILLIFSIVIFILSFQPFLIDSVFGNMQRYAIMATLITFVASLLIIIASLGYAWLNYKNYLFLMAEDSFKIKRGIFNKTESAIPYHQIENVNIERDLVFQMLGLSRLVILTAGHNDEISKKTTFGSDEAEGIIPAIDQKLAEQIQSEILKKTEIQKVVQTK